MTRTRAVNCEQALQWDAQQQGQEAPPGMPGNMPDFTNRKGEIRVISSVSHHPFRTPQNKFIASEQCKKSYQERKKILAVKIQQMIQL